MTKRKRKAAKRRRAGTTLRGAKEVLSHLRVVHGIRWHRATLWRRRTRPQDPFPGALLVVERRAFFVTTDVAVARWVQVFEQAPERLFIVDEER